MCYIRCIVKALYYSIVPHIYDYTYYIYSMYHIHYIHATSFPQPLLAPEVSRHRRARIQLRRRVATRRSHVEATPAEPDRVFRQRNRERLR